MASVADAVEQLRIDDRVRFEQPMHRSRQAVSLRPAVGDIQQNARDPAPQCVGEPPALEALAARIERSAEQEFGQKVIAAAQAQ